MLMSVLPRCNIAPPSSNCQRQTFCFIINSIFVEHLMIYNLLNEKYYRFRFCRSDANTFKCHVLANMKTLDRKHRMWVIALDILMDFEKLYKNGFRQSLQLFMHLESTSRRWSSPYQLGPRWLLLLVIPLFSPKIMVASPMLIGPLFFCLNLAICRHILLDYY